MNKKNFKAEISKLQYLTAYCSFGQCVCVAGGGGYFCVPGYWFMCVVVILFVTDERQYVRLEY